MTRLFSKSIIDPNQELFILDEADSKYLTDVLRMRIGDAVILCDAERIDYTGVISVISKKKVTLTLSENHKNESDPPYIATLFQGLAKGERMDLAIQKSVELGVAGIVPVSCIRSIVRINPGDVISKTSRWQKIAEEAARQSGRGYIPEVYSPQSFEEAIRKATDNADLVLIPWEEETGVSLPNILEKFVQRSGFSGESSRPKESANAGALPRIAVFIGPEGGFDRKEIEFAVAHGAASVSLGKRILRTETAGIAVLSMLLYRLELM
jgi:16S rRNA (uracil1498-N3)-methyltransferase